MRKIVVGGVAVALVVAGSLYASPYWALSSMRKAVEQGNAGTVSEYVDFPALREDIKGKLMLKMARSMPAGGEGNAFAGLGQMLAMGMVNQLVETLVSPSGVMLMLANGKPMPASEAAPTAAEGAAPERTRKDLALSYRGWSQVHVGPKDEPGGLVFRRDGLWGWKLVAVDMPQL